MRAWPRGQPLLIMTTDPALWAWAWAATTDHLLTLPARPAALRVRAEKEIAELYVASVRARKFGGQLGLGIRGEARELQGATTRSTASRSPFALKLGGWTDRSTLHLSSYGPVEAPFLPSFIWQWREGNALEARNCHRFLLRLTCLAAGLPACLPAFGASSPNSSTEE